jgi:hypothetical protein
LDQTRSGSATEKVVIMDDGKQRKLSLRTSGGELEWELLYSTRLVNELVVINQSNKIATCLYII